MDWATILVTAAGIVSIMGVLLHPVMVAMRNRERQRDRDLLLKLAQEKLDVLRSAIAAGYDEEQLTQLDNRLERLLGQQQFRDLVTEIGAYTDAEGKTVVETPLLSLELGVDAGVEETSRRQKTAL